MNSKLRALILIGLPILLSILLSNYLQIYILKNQEQFTTWLAGFGPWIILVYIILQALTVIIAPLGGFFMVVAMISLFGPGLALTLSYLVSTPCYLINFYLARRFGRPLVKRIIGGEPLEKLDEYVKDEGMLTLIVTRLLQGGYYDYLSYGWGLTKISFKTFALVNFLAGIPASIITYLVIAEFKNLTYGVIAFYITSLLLTLVAIILRRTFKKL